MGELGPVGLVLLYLACGALTFPLTIGLVRAVVRVAAPARATPAFHDRLDRTLAGLIVAWILGVLIAYAVLVLIEHQRPCTDQRTNQLTDECKRKLGAIP